jgi:hypothetical protein
VNGPDLAVDDDGAERSPFREALANITGTSWLDEAARSSLRAADSKFFGTPPGPTSTEEAAR